MYEIGYELVWKSMKKYELNFLVENYELNSSTNLSSGIDMNWCMKWFYEFLARNSELLLFHTFSYFFSLYIVWKSMKKYEKVWKVNLWRPHSNKSIIYWSFLLRFSSSKLLGSRDCCMRGSNFLTFGHSSRPWHPSSTVPHPHIHFVNLKACCHPRCLVVGLHAYDLSSKTWQIEEE